MTSTRDISSVGVPASWNGSRTPYPDKCIHTLFAEQVRRTPNAIAIECGDTRLTYRALGRMVDDIAGVLAAAGLEPGASVAVSRERSPEFVAALLGILKAGGAYLPIDAADPRERLEFMLDDASVRFVLGSTNQRQTIERLRSGATFIDLANLDAHPAGEVSKTVEETPRQPAYIIYTSGSTGTPKGVIVNHRGVVRLVRDTNYLEITASDVFLQLARATFDPSVLEIFGALLNGARLAIPPAGQLSLGDIEALIQRHRVSILVFTTGLFHALIDERPQALRGARQVLIGGDVLSPEHVRRALASLENGCVINGYGPTENATLTSCYRIVSESQIGDTVPIGTPISNSSVYILNSSLHPVEVGETGEIYIGGDGLAIGYLNRPEIEREKFVPNPFAAGDCDSRLYRSGDLGRFNADGLIEFCGRIDDQIKVRGFRIEPGEIENAAMLLPGIAQAVVMPVVDASGDKSLVCHYSCAAGYSVDPEELRAHLAGRLPAYMVPSAFESWEALPLTANGKVDRKMMQSKMVQEGTAPSTAKASDSVPDAIAEIFGSVLGGREVSLDDDFFALGGHSLGAVRLFARIEERFGRRLPLSTMIDAPTPRKLAAIIEDRECANRWSPLVAVRAAGTQPPIFLVHAIGGNVLSYVNLHQLLPEDQPIYAFQAVGLRDGRMAQTTIEEVAAGYVAELRAIQPEGPYHIGGFSSGGVVAYEMAQQLRRAGQEVATVLLLDSYIEPSALTLARSARYGRAVARALRTVAWNLDYAQRIGLHSFLQRKSHNFFLNLRIGFYQLRRSASRVFRSGAADHFLTIEEAFIIALQNYVPEPYDGPAVLLRTRDTAAYDPGNSSLWSKLIQRLDVVDVPGDHETMLQMPNVEVLATSIQNYLSNGALTR